MARSLGARSFDPLEETSASTEEQLRRWLRSDSEVSRLTEALTAHGGGVTSANLALDLVLNEIVRQACLATAATGAAIALLKDGEVVCCATTGASAPELGAQLDKKSGLSAICLRTGEAQRCDDTVIDARVNAAACRLLGIRSILVMPLQIGEEMAGVFEVFSSLPHAFADRDLQTLQALAGRILRSNPQTAASISSGKIAEFPSAPANDDVPFPKLTSTDVPSPEESSVYPADIAAIVESAVPARVRRDPWTLVLSGLIIVIACALLGLMLWRLGWPHAKTMGAHISAPAHSRTPTPVPTHPETVAPQPPPTQPPASRAENPPALPEVARPVPSEMRAKKDAAYQTPPGGLDIFQNGRRIYHLEPATGSTVTTTGPDTSGAPRKPAPPVSDAALVKKQPVATTKPVPRPGEKPMDQIDPEIAEQFVLDRVEPEYPEGARQKRIQGMVVLLAQVGKDGSVQDLKVLSGNPELVDAAVAAVRQWKYTPYTKANKPVPFQTRVTLSFALHD
ncbi:MAG TPA: TonB family protein [Terriglobales bacterium]|nr:TonB family protein [Terriglobales bacterium]